MEENQFKKDRLAKLLTIGLLSGIIAAGINICYMFLYESITGFSIPEVINLGSVAISSIIPGIFAGLLYFALRRFMDNGKALKVFIGVIIVAALLSFGGPLASQLPNGAPAPDDFAGLTLPMHILAPFIYIIMLVRSVPKH